MSPLLFSLSSKKAVNQHFEKKDFNYCTILTFFVCVYTVKHTKVLLAQLPLSFAMLWNFCIGSYLSPSWGKFDLHTRAPKVYANCQPYTCTLTAAA